MYVGLKKSYFLFFVKLIRIMHGRDCSHTVMHVVIIKSINAQIDNFSTILYYKHLNLIG